VPVVPQVTHEHPRGLLDLGRVRVQLGVERLEVDQIARRPVIASTVAWIGLLLSSVEAVVCAPVGSVVDWRLVAGVLIVSVLRAARHHPQHQTEADPPEGKSASRRTWSHGFPPILSRFRKIDATSPARLNPLESKETLPREYAAGCPGKTTDPNIHVQDV
jgi:hypothetical protein